MDASSMLLERNAAEPCVPGWGRRAAAKYGISHDSTSYNVFPVSASYNVFPVNVS
jgi:hypothetical protein